MCGANHESVDDGRDRTVIGGGRGTRACAENGIIRIMSNPAYSKETRFAISDLIELVRAFVSQTNHEFWPDDLSLRNGETFNPAQLHSSGRLTDTYLLALASRRKGRLATLDKAISIAAVKHAKSENLIHI